MTIKTKLERIQVAEFANDPILPVGEEGEPERRIEVARIKYGGMTLVNDELSRRGGQRILSAFFYINIMGHDLERWLHFDLEAGAQIDGSINPMRAANRRPDQGGIETEKDRMPVADRQKIIIDRWGAETVVKRSE